MSHFRQLVTSHLDSTDFLIGGEGIIVEIDESKFGRRKYNRGHRVPGVWVVGGIERTREAKYFVKEIESRDRETLLDVIKKHVLPGSIIYTDLWKGYTGLEQQGYEHHTVNHSQHFVDPVTQIHTNRIEGLWNGLKMNIRPRNRVKCTIEDHLFEAVWRKKHQDNLWQGFLDALNEVHFDFC